jgi:uncharacterized RDD family membrane protein YckC
MTGAVAAAGDAPGLARRLACFVYEGVLLFGVLMVSGYLYSSLTQQRNALEGRHGLQAFVFAVLGIYFVWFWSHGGQTVAMKAWHIRVVTREGHALSEPRALVRYLLAWAWFVPALLALALTRPASVAPIAAALLLGVAGYALLSLVLPGRQFLHDAVCGTRLVDWRDGHNRAP